MLPPNGEPIEPYIQDHAIINSRNVWLYLFSTSLGNIFVIEMEKKDQSLETTFILNNFKKANKKFNSCIRKILKEKGEN